MNLGKILRITDDRYIYLIENEDFSFVKDDQIRYRNIGLNYDQRLIETAFVHIKDGLVNVLNAVGNTKFHFPAVWLQ